MKKPHVLLMIAILFCLTVTYAQEKELNTSQTQIVILGSGNPNPDPEHAGPSVAIFVNGTPYIIDFGAGVIRQAAAVSPQYGGNIKGFDVKNIKKAFLTHLHSDHTVGYADLILTPWVMGRNEPLEVYGPEGIKEMTENLLKAYQEDIKYRLYGLEPANNKGWRVKATEIEEGIIYTDENVKVEAFLVKHGSWPNAYGFRFTTPDKVIVISGDAAPCENIIKYSKDADVLIHEVYYKKGYDTKTEFWRKYHAENHTSTFELGEIANKVKPKLLILYHTLYWGGTDEDLLNEISQVYKGKVVVGNDLMIF